MVTGIQNATGSAALDTERHPYIRFFTVRRQKQKDGIYKEDLQEIMREGNVIIGFD